MMNNYFTILRLLLAAVITLTTFSCTVSKRKNCADNVPVCLEKCVGVEWAPDPHFPVSVSMIATQGPIKVDSKTYQWVNTAGGRIELKEAKITSGVVTDKGLFADYSDMRGLKIGGEAWISKSVVRGKSVVAGEVNLSDSLVDSDLEVQGNLNASETIFFRSLIVSGNNIDADQCSFRNTFQTHAKFISLSGTETKGIKVFPAGRIPETQIVQLSNKADVQGDNYFHSGQGVVLVDHTSCLHGTVFGGSVVQTRDYFNNFY